MTKRKRLTSRVTRKLRPGGVRGFVASGLRYVARRLEGGRVAGLSGSRTDEFLRWVRFGVPGMLDDRNVDAMDYAIANMPAGHPVLEIGSFCGLSTVVLSHLLEKHRQGLRLFTCDEWLFEGQRLGAPLGESASATHDDFRTYVRDTFIRSMHTFSERNLPYPIECLSDEFFRRWFEQEEVVDVFGRSVRLGGGISFCYIDGNHSYEFVRRDFENADRALVAGGLILFDDSADGTEWEVNRLTREIALGSQYELVSRNPNYLFRKR